MSQPRYVTLCVSYGTLRPNQPYKVIEFGYDWVLLRAQGRAIYVPVNLLGRMREAENNRYEQDMDEYN